MIKRMKLTVLTTLTLALVPALALGQAVVAPPAGTNLPPGTLTFDPGPPWSVPQRHSRDLTKSTLMARCLMRQPSSVRTNSSSYSPTTAGPFSGENARPGSPS